MLKLQPENLEDAFGLLQQSVQNARGSKSKATALADIFQAAFKSLKQVHLQNQMF